MTKVERIATTILALSIALTMAACGGNGNISQTTGSQAAGGQTTAKETPPSELSALIVKHDLTKDLNEMNWLKEMENSVNVRVEWQQITTDWSQKKAPMFASGDIPDILIHATDSSDYATYPGLFEDLTPWIKEYAPDVKTMFNEVPNTLALATEIDGKIYGLPYYEDGMATCHGTALINKKWCDNLGLSLPTTWDELYNVLVAFRDRDPNQNGQNDEIPMDSWYFSSFGFFNLLGSTGIQCVDLNNENYYFAEDGKVKCIFNDVRLKRFLSFLNKLYAEKLINQEVFTRDYSTMITMAQGDPETKTAKVGLNFSWSAESLYGPALADQYVALPPIKESAGSTIEPRYTFDDLRYGANMIVMSANTKDKAAAMRLINAFYSPEYSIQSRFGGIGEGIEQTSNGYKLLPSADPSIDRDTYTWLITINSYGPYYISESLNSRFEREITGAFAEKVAYNEAHARIDWKKDYLGIKFFKISPEDYETMGLNSANFNVISYWAKWVTEGGIENEWDAYIDHLTKNGLEENLKILQKYQDAYIANMK